MGFAVTFDGADDAEKAISGQSIELEIEPAVPLESAEAREFISGLIGSAAQRYLRDHAN